MSQRDPTMSQRGRVVIEIEDSPPLPESQSRHVPQRIPDTLFFTPSESDSDHEPKVIWDTRKQRNDQVASKPKANTAQPIARPNIQPSLPPHLVAAQQQQQLPQQLPQQRPQQRQQQQQQQQHPQYNRVSITNPATQRLLAALSKSGSAPSSTAPVPAPGSIPVPPARPQLSQQPLPAAPDRSPRPYALTPATTKVFPSAFAGNSTRPAASQPVKRPPVVSKPTWTPPVQHKQNAPPSSSTHSKASPNNVSKQGDKNQGHPQEVLSKKVASPIAPSSRSSVVNAKPSSSGANSSPHTGPNPQKVSPCKEPVRLPTSPKKPPPSPARQHLPSHKPMLNTSVIEIDSSDEDDPVVAAASPRSAGNGSSSQNSPRVGKRKLVELDDDEPIKRIRRTRSSIPRPESSTPLISSNVSQDDVVGSVENDSHQKFKFPTDLSKIRPFANRFGQPFTPEEDALVIHLKEVVKISWKDFERFFPGRKWASMQSRYSKVLTKRTARPVATSSFSQHATGKEAPYVNRELRRAHAQANLVDSLVASQEKEEETEAVDDPNRCRRSVRPLNYLVRHRELGSTLGREWPRKFQAGVRDLVYSSMGAQAYMDNASGDVSTIAWSPDGESFAAGAVAVTDIQSVDYNKPRNLVIGSAATQKIKELPHHTIKCRLPDGRRKELFSTVQAVAFSPESKYMYSTGIDKHLHKYRVGSSPLDTTLVCKRKHPASVDFLSVSNSGLVATGNASSGSDSIHVYSHYDDELAGPVSFSGLPQVNRNPSALKWGIAHHHQDYLLAGFSREAEVIYQEDDHRDKEGEVGLWDIRTQQRMETDAPNRNVFDLAWNPTPGGNSTIFAVASRPMGHVSHGIHSVVRLYSPQQTRAQHTMELDCPAWDINDVVYSPHDNNLIAVGSTEGCVYIWDVRYAKHGQHPLNALKHGESLAIMPYGKKRWETDTGVRFLSWGSERDRLYTGSSDGVVACWDPYRSDSDKHIRDVVQLNSAVMSGAFSPDFSRLLIGEDAARLNLLSVGNDGARFNRMTTARFSVEQSPLQEEDGSAPILWDCQNMLETQELEVKPAGTMPFRQVVQGPNYSGPWRLTAEAATRASREILKETATAREESQKLQDKILMSLRRRKKQTRKSGLRPTDPCSLDCGFIPLPDDYVAKEVWLSERIPDPSSDWIKKRAETDCFRCGNKATISSKARAIGCRTCGTAWRIGALGYEVIEQVKASAPRGKVEEGDTDVVDLCDSEDERDRFVREVSASESDSDLEAPY
ncbi:WD40 repeat-like protein [Aureobasidium sp. EXF-3400]|nr:WD40 repeat-like protein [Aureobasidium sp. EXF-12344]KAI4773610.1 WD40 repeat-like protein [Aureobasidium sp. EXF-3400]